VYEAEVASVAEGGTVTEVDVVAAVGDGVATLAQVHRLVGGKVEEGEVLAVLIRLELGGALVRDWTEKQHTWRRA
jgi:hypothetical protein